MNITRTYIGSPCSPLTPDQLESEISNIVNSINTASIPTSHGVVSVKDYGAKGDGIHDDTDAIKTAISTGKDVYIPSTTAFYLLTSTLAVSTANQRIYGDGARSKIQQTGTVADSSVFFVSGTGVTIESMWLLPNPVASGLTYGFGVFLQNTSKCKLRGLIISGHRTGAIGVYMSDYNLIEGCIARDAFCNPPDISTTGVDFGVTYGGNYNLFTHNISMNGAGTGFSVGTFTGGGTGNYNSFVGNVVYNAATYGMCMYHGASGGALYGTNILDNVIDKVTGNIDDPVNGYCYGTGIYIQGAEYAAIKGNQVNNTNQYTGTGLLAPAGIGTSNCSVVTIVGNNVANTNNYAGISVRDPNSSGTVTGFANIVGNNIYNCKDGIEVVQRGRVNITGNTVDTCSQRNIYLANSSDQVMITLSGNVCRNAATAGITASYVTGLAITGNQIQLFGAGGNYGISADHTTDLTVMNNTLSNPSSGAYGIGVASTVTNGLVMGNYVTGCSSGTGLSNSSSSVIAIGNKIFANNTNYSGGTFVTDTELGYISGVTSAIQTQLNSKIDGTASFVTIGNTTSLSNERALTGTTNQVTVTDNGANSSVVLSTPQDIATTSSPQFTNLTLTGPTASTALTVNASKQITASSTTDTELGHVHGVTSAIQTQLDSKAPAASPTFTGAIKTPLTVSSSVVTDASGNLTASATTAAELGYAHGVTSAIQTQIDTKALDSGVVHNTGNETVAGTKTFSSKPILTVGALDDTQYTALQVNAEQGQAATHGVYTTTGVSTAKQIWGLTQYCELILVTGSDGTNVFSDLIMAAYGSGAVTTIVSRTGTGSPSARTYSVATGALKVAMASGTYTVTSYGFTIRNR